MYNFKKKIIYKVFQKNTFSTTISGTKGCFILGHPVYFPIELVQYNFIHKEMLNNITPSNS